MIEITYMSSTVARVGNREEVQAYVDLGHENNRTDAFRKWLALNPETKTVRELRLCISVAPFGHNRWMARASYDGKGFSYIGSTPSVSVEGLSEQEIVICE